MRLKRYSIDLSEQMAICDANYIRILKLLPNLELAQKKEIVLPLNNKVALGIELTDQNLAGSEVSLEVVETFKYTSTIKISQVLSASISDTKMPYAKPEMLVRVYHDANTAEVINYQGHQYFKASYPALNEHMYHMDEKEQLNLFLSQWLQLCLQEGLHPSQKVSEEYLTCLERE